MIASKYFSDNEPITINVGIKIERDTEQDVSEVVSDPIVNPE